MRKRKVNRTLKRIADLKPGHPFAGGEIVGFAQCPAGKEVIVQAAARLDLAAHTHRRAGQRLSEQPLGGRSRNMADIHPDVQLMPLFERPA